jgi:hypothetical protein
VRVQVLAQEGASGLAFEKATGRWDQSGVDGLTQVLEATAVTIDQPVALADQVVQGGLLFLREKHLGGIFGIEQQAAGQGEGIEAVGLVFSVAGLAQAPYAVGGGSIERVASLLEQGGQGNLGSTGGLHDTGDLFCGLGYLLEVGKQLLETLHGGGDAEGASYRLGGLPTEDEDIVGALASQVHADDQGHDGGSGCVRGGGDRSKSFSFCGIPGWAGSYQCRA